MTTQPNTTCTCPTGDGSLRWPCPVHTPAAAQEAVAKERPHVSPLPGAIRDVLEWYAEGPEFTAYHDDASRVRENEAIASGDFELTSHTDRGYRVYHPNGKRAQRALLELDEWEKVCGVEAMESFSAYAQGVEDALAGKHGPAPVTAAPADASALIQDLRAAVSIGRPLQHSDVDEIERALASTPAAPGIDAEVRRLVNAAKQYAQPMPNETQCLVISMAVAAAVIQEAVEAGARIDASPKGAMPALPDDFSESKDWRAGSYAERVEWLMDTVRSQREHIDDLLDSSKGSATEYCIDRAVEAFDDVFDGVSYNKREAIAAALAAGTKDSPKGGSEARDAARWRAVDAAGGGVTLQLHSTRPGERAQVIDAAMQAQAGDAEVQP